MTGSDPQPSGGCVCPQPYAELFTVIDGVQHEVRPADTLGPTEALHRAYCRTCHAEYPGHWRVADPPPTDDPPPRLPPTYQQHLW